MPRPTSINPSARPDRIGFLGHATVLLELDGVRLLTDPVLRRRVGPLRRQGRAPREDVGAGIDAVLISHLHRDHADLPSLRRLGTEAPLLVPPGAARFLAQRGFGGARELAEGESSRLGTLTVTATRAEHAVRRRGAAGAGAIGFLLEGRRRVYFAGDTDLFEGIEEPLGDLDLALLPIWGWGPSLGPGHLNPERAARTAALLSPRVVVPIHWGTLYPLGLSRLRPAPLHSPPREFLGWMARLAPQVEVRVLEPGEWTSLA